MKAQDIAMQLIGSLPRYNDEVSTFFLPESVSAAGKLVTVVRTAHDVVDGQPISVVGSKFSNDVASVVAQDAVNTLVTTVARTQLTVGYHETVRLESVTVPAANGDYPLVDMYENNQFVITGYTYAGAMPADLQLLEDREVGINGAHIATVVDDDTFTFSNSSNVQADLGIVASRTQVHNIVRITRAGSIKRMIEHYNATPPQALTLCVVLGGTGISKDENAYSDADMEQGGQSEWEGELVEPFHVYALQTLGGDTTGGAARDDMSDLRLAIFKSILGTQYSGGTVAGVSSTVYPVGDDVYDYPKGYYVHDFEFAQVLMISRADTNSDDPTVALGTISFSLENDKRPVLIRGEVDTQSSE